MILWDEHGRFYDHVSPPATVNPAARFRPSSTSRAWISAYRQSSYRHGLLPARFDHTLYDQSSKAILKALVGLRSLLTKRDAKANTFERLSGFDAALTDCPQRLQPATATLARAYNIAVCSLQSQAAAASGLQRSLVELANEMNPNEARPQHEITTEFQAARHAYRATVKVL